MSNVPTVRDIIESFIDQRNSFEVTSEPDAELLYLSTLISELESIEAAYAGYDSMESIKLHAACARIPGLLHLYKLY
jgi:hypothetical protein